MFFRKFWSVTLLLLLLFLQPAFSQQAATSSDSLQMKRSWFHSNMRWIISGGLVGLGTLSVTNSGLINRHAVYDIRQANFPHFHHKVDNIGQFVPIFAAYGLDLAGMKSQHDFVNRSVILVKSEVIMMALITPLKDWTHVLRPDSSDYHSFPSGHTAQAFMAANFFSHEYGKRSIWYSIAGYTVATGVGTLRILNNKHWISDVLAGAGIGIFSSELAYATHKYKWNRKRKISAMPYLGQHQGGLYVSVGL